MYKYICISYVNIYFSGIAQCSLNRLHFSPAVRVDGADPCPVLGLPHATGQLTRLLSKPQIPWLLEPCHQEDEESLKHI